MPGMRIATGIQLLLEEKDGLHRKMKEPGQTKANCDK
jgi:hypothetical protein